MQTNIGSLVVMVLAVLIAGCATPIDMRKLTPELDLTSSKTAKAVALCIADRWENTTVMESSFPISMRPTNEGYTIKATVEDILQQWTRLLADVNDGPNGSTTRYYKNGMLGVGSFDQAVKYCQ